MPFLPFLDSFDHYDSAHSSQKWGTPLTIINSVGRRGTQATQVGGGASLNLSPSTYGSLYVGGAWKNPGNMPFRVSSLVSGAMVGMQFVNDGRFVMAGTDPTALFQAFTGSQTTPPVLPDRYYYLEMKATITPNSISLQIWINEQLVLSDSHVLAGTLTLGAAWDTFAMQGNGQSFLDDFYLSDLGPFGDVDVLHAHPNGPWTTNWIPVPSGANWNNVKEVFSDDGATIVTSKFVGDLDLYTLGPIPSGLKIPAVQGLISANLSGSGASGIKLQYGEGSGAVLSAEFTLTSGFNYCRDGRNTAGKTSSYVNGLLFGPLRTT